MMWCILGKWLSGMCVYTNGRGRTILHVHGSGWLSLECSRKRIARIMYVHTKRVH